MHKHKHACYRHASLATKAKENMAIIVLNAVTWGMLFGALAKFY